MNLLPDRTRTRVGNERHVIGIEGQTEVSLAEHVKVDPTGTEAIDPPARTHRMSEQAVALSDEAQDAPVDVR